MSGKRFCARCGRSGLWGVQARPPTRGVCDNGPPDRAWRCRFRARTVVGIRVRAAMTVPTTAGPVVPSGVSRVRPAIQEPRAVPRLKAETVQGEQQCQPLGQPQSQHRRQRRPDDHADGEDGDQQAGPADADLQVACDLRQQTRHHELGRAHQERAQCQGVDDERQPCSGRLRAPVHPYVTGGVEGSSSRTQGSSPWGRDRGPCSRRPASAQVEKVAFIGGTSWTSLRAPRWLPWNA